MLPCRARRRSDVGITDDIRVFVCSIDVHQVIILVGRKSFEESQADLIRGCEGSDVKNPVLYSGLNQHPVEGVVVDKAEVECGASPEVR